MCWISFIGKKSTSSQNQTSQIKIRNIQCVLKRLTAGVEQSNCPRLQHLYLQLQKISTKTAIFIATKHEKTGNYLNLFSIFSQQYKKSNRSHDILLYTLSFSLAKTQISTWSNFYYIFIQISGKYMKYLTQRHTCMFKKITCN